MGVSRALGGRAEAPEALLSLAWHAVQHGCCQLRTEIDLLGRHQQEASDACTSWCIQQEKQLALRLKDHRHFPDTFRASVKVYPLEKTLEHRQEQTVWPGWAMLLNQLQSFLKYKCFTVLLEDSSSAPSTLCFPRASYSFHPTDAIFRSVRVGETPVSANEFH